MKFKLRVDLINYPLNTQSHVVTVTNPLQRRGNYSATSNNTYTGRWWVGCYIWYSEEGTGRGHSLPKPLLAVPNVTAQPSTASVPITVLLNNGPLLCSFDVPINSEINGKKQQTNKVAENDSSRTLVAHLMYWSIQPNFPGALVSRWYIRTVNCITLFARVYSSTHILRVDIFLHNKIMKVYVSILRRNAWR